MVKIEIANTLIEKATINANKIHDALKEQKGKTFRKTEIIVKFNLPYSQSIFIFEILRSKGYSITRRGVTVPS